MPYIEDVVEERLRLGIKACGGLCYKFTSGIRGVPDRVVIINGHTIFVELKAPGKKPPPLQRFRINEMRQQGADVRIIDTIEGVDAFITEVTQPNPNYRTAKE